MASFSDRVEAVRKVREWRRKDDARATLKEEIDKDLPDLSELARDTLASAKDMSARMRKKGTSVEDVQELGLCLDSCVEAYGSIRKTINAIYMDCV